VQPSPWLLKPLLAYYTSPGWWWVWSNRWNAWQAVPVSLCPPQIPHGLTQARNRPAAVGSRRLTAWATARSYDNLRQISSLHLGLIAITNEQFSANRTAIDHKPAFILYMICGFHIGAYEELYLLGYVKWRFHLLHPSSDLKSKRRKSQQEAGRVARR
jgi:hypothetical protein